MRSLMASGGQPCSGTILTAEKEGMYRLINVPMVIYRVDIHFYSFCAAAYSKTPERFQILWHTRVI